MIMTEPNADFLTRLRNANSAYHDEVTLPHSKNKVKIPGKPGGKILWCADVDIERA